MSRRSLFAGLALVAGAAFVSAGTMPGPTGAAQDKGKQAKGKGGGKGKAKEVAGIVTGNEERQAEGKAQQDKAAAQRQVAEKEAQAEKARAESQAHDLEERSHQR